MSDFYCGMGLIFENATTPAPPDVVFGHSIQGGFFQIYQDLAFYGTDYLVVLIRAGSGGGIMIVDITNPYSMSIVYNNAGLFTGTGGAISIVGDYAIINTSSGSDGNIYIIDISALVSVISYTAISADADLSSSTGPTKHVYDAGTIYVPGEDFSNSTALASFDVSSLPTVTKLDVIDVNPFSQSQYLNRPVVRNNNLYGNSFNISPSANVMNIVDVSSPSAMSYTTSVSFSSIFASDLERDGGEAIGMSSGAGGSGRKLHVWDLDATPSNPPLSTLTLGDVFPLLSRVPFDASHFWVIENNSGSTRWNSIDRATLTIDGTFSLDTQNSNILTGIKQGDFIYACKSGGILSSYEVT